MCSQDAGPAGGVPGGLQLIESKLDSSSLVPHRAANTCSVAARSVPVCLSLLCLQGQRTWRMRSAFLTRSTNG